MTKDELASWLCGDDADVPTVSAVAAALGVELDEADERARLRDAHRLAAARFTLAVLRDAFTTDRAVRRWLRTPRPELGGLSPLDMLWAGHVDAVETLAVHTWHHPTEPPAPAHAIPYWRSRHADAPGARSSARA